MATQLKNIVAFANIAAGGNATLAHGLNIDGLDVLPDLAQRDNTDFAITAVTDTSVTVENRGQAVGSTNVLVEHWHTIERVFGSSAVKSLAPQPFLPAGGFVAASTYEITLTSEREEPGVGTRPLAVVGGATLGYQMAIGNRMYSEFPLHPLLDRSADITIEIAWAPASSENNKTVTWQLNALAAVPGSSVAGAGTPHSAVDVAVPAVAGTYVVTTVSISAAEILAAMQEFHIRLLRVASTSDPVTDPAVDHIDVVQQLTV